MKPGRTCPLHYRYAPEELARNTPLEADCIYAIGGLYGNRPALDAIFDLAAREPQAPTLVFNGDFNWFNIDGAGFEGINRRVLAHVALRGNVETELAADDSGAGCGCGYPEFVADAEVERSNRIMALLRDTAHAYPPLRQNLATLPTHAAARVGAARIAIVHGDCESLAGWGLSQEALAGEEHKTRVRRWLEQARVDIIASSHSCLPVMMDFETARGRSVIVNNGAAGMPNFRDSQYGVITRIATRFSRHARPLYATRIDDVYVEALPVHYDNNHWQQEFLANWPAGSPAHVSYYRRIMRGPRYGLSQALRLRTPHPRAAFSASRLEGA